MLCWMPPVFSETSPPGLIGTLISSSPLSFLEILHLRVLWQFFLWLFQIAFHTSVVYCSAICHRIPIQILEVVHAHVRVCVHIFIVLCLKILTASSSESYFLSSQLTGTCVSYTTFWKMSPGRNPGEFTLFVSFLSGLMIQRHLLSIVWKQLLYILSSFLSTYWRRVSLVPITPTWP